MPSGPNVAANLQRFTGLAEGYDRFRPQPPEALYGLLTQLARTPRPALVVDLGSGTGLSTRYWLGRADQVVGIEPNADMRAEAARATEGLPGAEDVSYEDGLSSATGLPDGCADLVTCSQSLHWMEPESTFAEAARVLRPGGVFAAYDYDWPPVIHPEVEEAFLEVMRRADALDRERRTAGGVRWWTKSGHLERMRASGRFRYVREALLHSVEEGDPERLVGMTASQGTVGGLLRESVPESRLGLDVLRATAERVMGAEQWPWYLGYRVRLGVC